MRTPDAEIQCIQSAEIFHGKVIDLSSQTITLELQGKEVRPRHTMPTEHYACEYPQAVMESGQNPLAHCSCSSMASVV